MYMHYIRRHFRVDGVTRNHFPSYTSAAIRDEIDATLLSNVSVCSEAAVHCRLINYVQLAIIIHTREMLPIQKKHARVSQHSGKRLMLASI